MWRAGGSASITTLRPLTPSGSNTTWPGSSDTLPNGYCGRPPQQDCPHPNACLTCPDFQTTIQFLPVHRRQVDATSELIEAAEAAGHERLAANHRRVLTNLDKIIPALEHAQQDALGDG